MTHIKIKYKDHQGYLETATGVVVFYDVRYKSIIDAINLENNLNRDKEDTFFVENLKLPKPIVISFRTFHTEYNGTN